MRKLIFTLLFSITVISTFANNMVDETVNNIFQPLVDFLSAILFFDPFAAIGLNLGVKIPFIIIWLISGALFFTIYFKFINVRGIKHAIDLVRGKFDKEGHSGEISHFQALATATASTVGLGNIAGVAIAISLGGPGATFWMIIAGLLGMTTKFTECTLGVKYRNLDENNIVSGGPMYYLKKGFSNKGWKRTGQFLSVLFAVLTVFGALGIGNMFQSNQVIAQVVTSFPAFENYRLILGISMAVLVGIVIIGGIKGIANVNDKLFPIMAITYFLACFVILTMNFTKLDDAVMLIINGAFSPEATKGGIVGVMIIGFRRAAFSNEAGIGSAAIAHSTVKTEQPITEGYVALLEPFIDTVVICTLTALVIISTGLYTNPDNLNGSELTSAAFKTVSWWFPYLLVPIVFLFAYTTIISWSYYGSKNFDFLFGRFFEKRFGKRIIATRIYQIFFLLFTALGSVLSLGAIVDFSDMLVLCMAVPNIIGLYVLAPEVKAELKAYQKKVIKKSKIK
jgi:alanine or glycine:cation symporter, AGCS family